MLEKLGRYDAAERELLLAIKLNPDNPLPYQELGTVKIAKEEYKEAIKYLLKAMERKGNNFIILNNLAVASLMDGDYSAALVYVKKAESLGLQLNPDLVHTIISTVRNR